MVGMALKYWAEINLVIDNASIDKPVYLNNFRKHYFCYDSAGTGISATREGPSLSVTLVQLDSYPVLAAKIKREFNLCQQAGYQVVLL